MGLKKHRLFIVECCVVPGTLFALFGEQPSPWEYVTQFNKLAPATALLSSGREPGFFKPGTQYRVRRTDIPAAKVGDLHHAN